MEDLFITSPNDYANDIGAPVYHPHVSVVHYDEVGKIRHSLCHFNVYAIFVQKNFPENLTYGMGSYKADEDALLAYAPGQIGGKADDGTEMQYFGWVLLFDQEFIYGTELERNLRNYNYFSYNTNEALKLTDEEMLLVSNIIETIRKELIEQKPHMDRIIQDYILLLADLCNRFYDRQFEKEVNRKNDILTRFEDVLQAYYDNDKHLKNGIPTVKYCADELCMSPGYFGDVVRKALGHSPLQHIRDYLINRAKMLIASGKNITEVAEALGFEYPQHFTRVFKKRTGMLPSKYLDSLKK